LSRFQYENIQIDRGERINNEAHTTPVERFKQTLSGISPRPLLGQHNAQHWLSGAEHDVYGQVCEDPVVREQMMDKRMRKQQQILDDLSREEKLRIYGNETSRFTIITWGSTKGAVRDAIRRMIQQDIEVRAIQLRLLWPFPTAELADLLADALPLVVVECNYSGQLNALLRERLGRGADHLLVKYSGRPMSGDALFAALQEILAGNGTPRRVLHNSNE
jgi:2-oxoglutarate ferredoxin oxidoreductase subunit alpha